MILPFKEPKTDEQANANWREVEKILGFIYPRNKDYVVRGFWTDADPPVFQWQTKRKDENEDAWTAIP